MVFTVNAQVGTFGAVGDVPFTRLSASGDQICVAVDKKKNPLR
jgi:hypothetical protein